MQCVPSEAVIGAANRFVAFFRQLGETFIERDDLLQQIALALLGREHLLMTGPPGTAKSKVAQAVLGRIVCEESHQPSLFARQFTESTVQTDLVGPLDFKTLMETGRTQHFTDEGMLGATHAFLDEVFDGRDMLLRSTLNLLNERELKQGTKISRGKIECALMTTNRYLVEVLASERLVAFVDRIAFLNFVPKGFARPDALPEVLRRQVSGRSGSSPGPRLTIQDVDLLQDAADAVAVGPAICESVARLALSFDAALADARRADPSFASSRYVSTRGVVRLGQMLRAICLYDWAFTNRDRPLVARHQDLAGLRLGLTLCGPSTVDADKLMLTEADPRERRQLAIVRTERGIFERCLAGLPATAEEVAEEGIELFSGEEDALSLAAMNPAALATRARQLAADASGPRQTTRLAATVQELVNRAVGAGLGPGPSDDSEPLVLVSGLSQLADDIDSLAPAHRPTTRWLRGRALELVGQIAAVGPSPFAAVRQEVADSGLEAMKLIVDSQLGRMEHLASLRAGLRHAGAVETDAAGQDARWKEAVARTAERLWPDLAAAFALTAGRALERAPSASLKVLLEAISQSLAIARDAGARLSALQADGDSFFARVVSASLEPVVQQSFRSLEGESRSVVSGTVAENLAHLTDAGVLALIPTERLVQWMVECLLITDRRKPFRFKDRGAAPAFAHYRKMRKQMPLGTLAFTLIDLATRLPGIREAGDPDRIVARLTELARAFPEDLRKQLVARDLEYVEAPIAFLEGWWSELAASLPKEASEALARLTESRFFSITHDECALARFEQEARLVALVFPEADIRALVTRMSALASASTALVDRLSRQRLEAVTPSASRAASEPGG
jgi:MoxR-like ATPase